MLFASVGREADVGFIESVTTTMGGRFVGWLEVGFTTLSRFCADAAPESNPAENNAHTARQTILLENIKLKLLLFF